MSFVCPICGKKVSPRLETSAIQKGKTNYFPFCGRRCRLIDLGHWLEGEYAIASKADEIEDEQFGIQMDQ